MGDVFSYLMVSCNNNNNNNNINNNNNNCISGSISTEWLFACPMLTKFTIVKRLKDI